MGRGQLPALILMVLAGFFKLPKEAGTGFFSNTTTITRVGILVAVEREARPLVHSLGLKLAPEPLEAPLLGRAYTGNYRGVEITLAVNGQDPVHGVDMVGTVGAALTANSLIKSAKPHLLINAGFGSGKGTVLRVGDVILATKTRYHDRKLPETWKEYAVDATDTVATPKLLEATKWATGVVTTGNSVGEPLQTDADVKDTEAAAIAKVAKLHGTPFLCIKVVSEHIGDQVTVYDKGDDLLGLLQASVQQTLDFVVGKSASEL